MQDERREYNPTQDDRREPQEPRDTSNDRKEPRQDVPRRPDPRREERRSEPEQPRREEPRREERREMANSPSPGRELDHKRAKFQILDTDNLDPTDLDLLDNAQEAPVDLTQEYWTPEQMGESRRMVYTGIHDREIIDEDSGEVTRSLPCAFFLYKRDGEVQTVCNGSKRLVGAFENGKIRKGSPVSVTYLGRKKNKTNQYQSDQWSVKPLLIEI